MRWIAHIYLTNFYTSVQRSSYPEFAAEPLIILRHNRVLDMNAAAKETGVRLRSSKRHAYQCCPQGLFINYAAEEYRNAAEKVLTACLEYTPVIEPVAENEFYLELKGPQSPDRVVRELSIQITPAFSTGLSAGIGRNKFLARVANMTLLSGRVKSVQGAVAAQDPRALCDEPVGRFYWLNQEPGPEAARFLAALPVSYLWPLENSLKQRLIRLGFAGVAEVAALDQELLQREFPGQSGTIRALTLGQDPAPVLSLYPPKQLVKKLKFSSGVKDFSILEQGVEGLSFKLSAALDNRGEGCRRLSLELELEQGEQRSGTRSFNSPQNHPVTLREVLKALAGRMEINSAVLALKITAIDLRPLRGTQLTLFEDPKTLAGQASDRLPKLQTLLDNLGKRFAPRNFRLGTGCVLSRREQMLSFWDPLRFTLK